MAVGFSAISSIQRSQSPPIALALFAPSPPSEDDKRKSLCALGDRNIPGSPHLVCSRLLFLLLLASAAPHLTRKRVLLDPRMNTLVIWPQIGPMSMLQNSSQCHEKNLLPSLKFAHTNLRLLPTKTTQCAAHRFPPKSNKTPNPVLTDAPKEEEEQDDDDGIPMEHVKTLAKFKSRHNYIRVLDVSRRADHPLAGSRLLLLDRPGNIHSISFLLKTLTTTYFDVFASLPPLLSPGGGPIAILGFGAGSAARLILSLYPDGATPEIHGWELDPSVIAVAREFFGLSKLERQHRGRLFVYLGDALEAEVEGGFSGILVDLFVRGSVIPELQDPKTWETLRRKLSRGGRMMVNCGGRCVEAEDPRRDGGLVREETLRAMGKVFADEVFVLNLGAGGRTEDSWLALTGPPPDVDAWKRALPAAKLRRYVDMWIPIKGESRQ